MLLSKVIIVSLIGAVLGGPGGPLSDQACDSWNRLLNETQSLAGVQLQCTVNKYCTGLDCLGKYRDWHGKIQTHLQHCSEPVGLQVYLSIPQFGVQNWNHTFFHGERVPLPSLKMGADQSSSGFLEIYLQRQDESTVLLGVSIVQLGGEIGSDPISLTLIRNQTVRMPGCVNGHEPTYPPPSRQDKQLIRPVPYAVPLNSAILSSRQLNGNKPCNLEALEPCGVGEMCVQSQGTGGVCTCLAQYHLVDGVCQLIPIVPWQPSGNSTDNPTSDTNKAGTDSQLPVKIAVPVIMFVLLAVLAGLAYRFRWVPKIRARFRRSNIYEEMVIEGDDITTMHTPVANNPIA